MKTKIQLKFAAHLTKLFLFFLFFASAATVHAQTAPTTPFRPPTQPTELIVQYKRQPWEFIPQQNNVPLFRTVSMPEGADIDKIIQQYSTDPSVLSVEPNVIRYITTTPDDPSVSLQWHLTGENGIHATTAWETQTGSSEVVVAVIDTGVDVDHPDLADNMWINPGEIADNGIDDDGNGYVDDVHGVDLVDGDGDPTPDPDGIDNDNFGGADNGTEHGTHVAGIIAAVGNNARGVSGVAWDISIMGVRALDEEGSGTDTEIAEGIRYAADNGAHVINMSLGGYGSTSVLENAVEYAVEKGVTVIAAAGNDGININKFSFYPACYDDVLGVASTNQQHEASSFSNYGSDCVDVAAPGELIYSTLYSGDAAHGFSTDYGYMTGTSMATPVVAGVVGLLQSQDLTLDHNQRSSIVLATAENIGLTEEYGSGQVDLASALENIQIATYPQAPADIQAFADSTEATAYADGERTTNTTPYFVWEASVGTYDVTGYYVYFGKNKTANPVTEGTLQTETTFSPTIEDADANNAKYYLRIVSADSQGNTSINEAEFEYLYDTKVRPPLGVHAGKTSKGIRVTWNKVKNEAVTHYRVMRRVGDADFAPIATVTHPKHAYTDAQVQDGVKYTYTVQAIDDLKHRSTSDATSIRFIPQERVVMSAGVGGGPQIRIYNAETKTVEHSFFAFPASDRSGVEIAVGQLDDDAKDEIIAAHASGTPQVRLLNTAGAVLKQWNAYESTFTGGVHVAVGQLDDDDTEEIVVAPGVGRLPLVKVFDANATLVTSFLAMDEKWSKGMHVTTVNWDGKGADEIAVTPDAGGPGIVYIYSAAGKLLHSFNAGYLNTRSGLRLAAVRQKGTDREALVTVPVQGEALVKRFAKVRGVAKVKNATFDGFAQSYSSGASIATGDIAQTGTDRVVVGTQGERAATVNVYNLTGRYLQETITPFGAFQGAVNVAAGWF